MQHYIALILAHGSADGYSTESPECLHINFAKSAYRATNKKNYIIQMTKWLTHQEACSHFTAYLQWAVPGYCLHLQAVSELKEDDDGDDDNNKDGDGDGEEMERSRVLAQDIQLLNDHMHIFPSHPSLITLVHQTLLLTSPHTFITPLKPLIPPGFHHLAPIYPSTSALLYAFLLHPKSPSKKPRMSSMLDVHFWQMGSHRLYLHSLILC